MTENHPYDVWNKMIRVYLLYCDYKDISFRKERTFIFSQIYDTMRKKHR